MDVYIFYCHLGGQVEQWGRARGDEARGQVVQEAADGGHLFTCVFSLQLCLYMCA